MKTFRRLLRIARIALLTILAVYAGAALGPVNSSKPQPVVTRDSDAQVVPVETHAGTRYRGQAMAAAGTGLARHGFAEIKLGAL